MLIRLLCVAVIAGSFGFAPNAGVAMAGESTSVLAQLPASTMVALRVAQLDELDQKVVPLAKEFAWPLPPLGQLAASFDGVDSSGEFVLGMMQLDGEQFVPFLLLPVTDYKTFVYAGDGDAGIEVTPLTLAGEELMATSRGNWALVTNPFDDFTHLNPMPAEQSAELQKLVGSELASVIATRTGVVQLKAIALARSESPYQKATRYRQLQRRSIDWTDWQQVESLIRIYSGAINHLCESCEVMVLTADIDDDQSVALRYVTQRAGEVEFPAAEWKRSPLVLGSQRIITSGEGPWGSPWTADFVQLYLDRFEVTSYDFGINYLRPQEFRGYRESVTKVSDQIQGVQAMMIAPTDDYPVMSNSAMLVNTSDAAKLLESVDEAIKDWNRMIELSQRQVDFYLGSEPLKVGERQGRRYTVDLSDAFREANTPDVRKVMDRLYGRNGVWAIDVLPLDESRVLFTDLPDKLRDELIAKLDSEKPTATREATWSVTLNPAALQDWFNDCKRKEFEEGIRGWTPQEFASPTDLVVTATTHDSTLVIETKLPADVVQAMAKLWNSPQRSNQADRGNGR
ncbi:hypothetical protein [Aeoliella mucimassa]|uniref:Uncharacterized protein n=1 Tax=Aeoliella mucimassa TaxID=2527972 RepID=A0A518AP30_9BACT|nr:hypothetical protein [Aeoliella mucimassa]QDU56477.1 hypothetical protein Pan181_26860 [Aeoliella mucimassa]